MIFSETIHRHGLPILRNLLPFLLLFALTSGCSISGMKLVDRSSGNTAKGFVEFRINEGTDFSIMREPVAVYITREGENWRLGFVGSNFAWAPMGYIRQLVVMESPGNYKYEYTYQTMGKGIASSTVGVTYFGIEHYQGVISVDISANQTTPVTFSLGPKEVTGTLISRRLDPSQFNVEIGSPYEGKPQKVKK